MKDLIAGRIHEICSHYGMTTNELAQTIEMPKTTLNNYVNGQRKVNLELVCKLVDSLDIDANWLLTGKGQIRKENSRTDGDQLISSQNSTSISNRISGNNINNVGGHYINLAIDRKIKKLLEKEKISIEFEQSVELLQQRNEYLEARIKDLEENIALLKELLQARNLLINILMKK
ncbi:MAG: helix-turn-helix transcriptional regulator [Candidatus Azobacteroides sp.]|nr:helix-turn-helix transcriptional regulator [Candidatus Azobacteroides sp.]